MTAFYKGQQYKDNNTIGLLVEEKVASLTLKIPWGVKVHLGIEDAFAMPATKYEAENVPIHEKQNSTQIPTLHPENATTSLILKITCLKKQKSIAQGMQNIVVEAITLFTEQHGTQPNHAVGKTIMITHPWIAGYNQPNKLNHYFHCLPELTELELWASLRRSYQSDVVEMSQKQNKSLHPAIQLADDSYKMQSNMDIRFRFNYHAL